MHGAIVRNYPPQEIKEFRASIARAKGDELTKKCEAFVSQIFSKIERARKQPITHQMDSEMQPDPEADIHFFLKTYLSDVPEVEKAFNKELGRQSHND